MECFEQDADAFRRGWGDMQSGELVMLGEMRVSFRDVLWRSGCGGYVKKGRTLKQSVYESVIKIRRR